MPAHGSLLRAQTEKGMWGGPEPPLQVSHASGEGLVAVI